VTPIGTSRLHKAQMWQWAFMAALLLVFSIPRSWAGDDNEECHHGSPSYLKLSETDPTNLAKACRRLADQGNADAENSLGSMYRAGLGVPKDYIQAMEWYRKAADQGSASGENNIGVLFHDTHDDAEAAKWFRKSAEHGSPLGQFNLGAMYNAGQGVGQDYAEAARWYGKAANQGFSEAEYNLGDAYYAGQGVPQSYSEAAKWFRKAADQGHVQAQLVLGTLYRNGQGVPMDYVHAYMWLDLAASHKGVETSQRDELAATMAPPQIEQARALVAAWKPTPQYIPH